MARLGAGAKVRRVVEFLLGLRDERVSAALAGCGFTATERAKGWQLLQALGMTDVARDVRQDGDLQSKLDAWHNHWFRVAKVCLQRDFPRVYDQIFLDLNQMPQSSIILVQLLLKRIEKLTRAKDADSQAALAKLRARGLTPERIAEAEQLVAQLVQPSQGALPDLQQLRAAVEHAEAALWDYYVEWSQLARMAVKDPRLLKLMGFRGGANDDDAELEPAAPPAVPAAEVPARATPKRKATRRGKVGKRRVAAR